MTTSEFVKKYNGGKWDFDFAFSSQCVDLMRFYIRDVLDLPQPKSVVGAKDFWFNYSKDLNLKNNFKQISNSPDGIAQEGDIMIWDKWTGNKFGHVAICLDASLNSFDSIDQNFDGKLKTQIVKHNYLNPPILGWLRPYKFMNFIDLKKRLNDTNWSELKEFSDLEKLKVIERADSIQTMMMKWLKAVENEAILKESDRQKGVKIEMLTEGVEGLKTQQVASQAEIDLLVDKIKTKDVNIEKLMIERGVLELKIEKLELGTPTFLEVVFNYIKKWLKI